MNQKRSDAGDGRKVTTEVKDGHVEVAIEVTKNLGNFENFRIRVSYGRSVNPGETPDEAFNRVYGMVDRNLSRKLKEELA